MDRCRETLLYLKQQITVVFYSPPPKVAYPHLSSDSVTQNLPVHLMQFDCTMLSSPELCKYGSEHFRELPLENPQLECYPLVTDKVIVTLHLFSKLLDMSQESIAV